jgi:hypothetical protein
MQFASPENPERLFDMSKPSPFALLVIDETLAQRYAAMNIAPMLEPSSAVEASAAAGGLIDAARSLIARVRSLVSR